MGPLLAAVLLLAHAPDTTWRSVDRAVARGITAGGFPGLAVVVGRSDTTLLARGYGQLGWNQPGAVNPDRTIYDLASLTKVVATTTAAMVLYDRGQLDLDAPVSHYLPEWSIGSHARVTVRELLTHRSGLPAGRDLWQIARSSHAARAAVLTTPLETSPGGHYIYSDLGADIMGLVVERISHEPLDVFLQRRVYGPLGMRSTRFRPPPAWRRYIARTEAPTGRVLDRNAAALGGVAGHAGLFSSAADLAVFARLMLGNGTYRHVRIFSDSTVARFTRAQFGSQALGWELCSGASCGQYMSPAAFGHTGYTGTSLWIDPVHDVFVVVLANWASGSPAHPAGPIAILDDVRADIADLAVASVAGAPQGPVPEPTAVDLRSPFERGW